MMARAGRFHGMRASGLAVVAALVVAAGLYVRTKYEEKGRKTAAAGLVSQLLAADHAPVLRHPQRNQWPVSTGAGPKTS